MKLCIGCKHHILEKRFQEDIGGGRWYDEHRCYYFAGRQSPISGFIMTHVVCDVMRLGPCGWDGKFWEEAAPK